MPPVAPHRHNGGKLNVAKRKPSITDIQVGLLFMLIVIVLIIAAGLIMAAMTAQGPVGTTQIPTPETVFGG